MDDTKNGGNIVAKHSDQEQCDADETTSIVTKQPSDPETKNIIANQLELQTNQLQPIYYCVEKCENLHLAPSYTVNINNEDQLAAFASILEAAGTSSSSATNPCCNETKENQFPCEVLQQKLQEVYRDLILPKVPWLNDGIDLPIQEYFMELKLTDSKKSIQIEDIFNKVNNDKQPLRILIEGQPGYGKTTLAIKLANDWANTQNKYIKHFKLVFLLSLRELENENIEETITAIGKEVFGLEENQNVIEIVNKHQKETLFILDGLDEVSLEGRESILKTLYNKEYKEVTVIVFSRTGLFNVTQDEHRQLFKSYGNIKSKKFHDKQITILGICNKSKKIHFLQKVLKEEYTKYEDTIENLSAQLKFFDSPLFLMMLIIILEENDNIKSINTKTEIYKQLFNSIIKRSYMRSGKTLDKDVDLFNINMPLNYEQQLIHDFGKFSHERIIENKLQFKPDELTNKIYDAGFLINHEEVTIIKKKSHYEAFHLSFLEFSSAYALWIQIKFNHSNVKELLKQCVMHFYETRGTSLVLVFLASLMDKDLQLFLSQIKSYSAFFSSYFSLIVKLLSECASVNIMQDFLPTSIKLSNIYFKSPVISESLLMNGTQCGKINRVLIYFGFKLQLIPNNIIPNAKIILMCKDDWISSVQLKVNCNPRTVIAHMKNCLNHSQEFGSNSRNWLNFLTSPNIASCSIDLTDYIDYQCGLSGGARSGDRPGHRVWRGSRWSDRAVNYQVGQTCDLPKFYYGGGEKDFAEGARLAKAGPVDYIDNEIQIILEQQFNNIKYNYLKIHGKTEFERKIVTQLIQNNQVEFVYINNCYRNFFNLTNFYHAAVQSTNLNYIELTNICFDLYELTAGGTKKYKYMSFFYCVISCSQPLIQKNCCEYLRIRSMKDFRNIENIEPKSLKCSCDVLEHLINRDPKWHGFINLEHLELCPESILNSEVIASLNNLHSLLLHDIDLYFNECTIDCILKLPIVKFGIYEPRDRSNTGYTLLDYLIKRVSNALAEKTNVHLKTIHYFVTSEEPLFNQELSQLLEVIKYENIEKVIIVYYLNIFGKRYINFDNFNVVHYKYGSHDDDFDYYKILYSKENNDAYNALCITKK